MKQSLRLIHLFAAITCMTAYNLLKASPFGAAPLYLAIAATSDVNTPEYPGEIVALQVAAATKIYAGTIVCLNAAGYAVPGADTAGLVGFGRAEFTVDNTLGAAGALTVNVRRGVFLWANSAAHPLVQASLGTIAYVEDDNTVAVSSDNAVKAGTVVRIDSRGYWIDTRYHVPTVGAPADSSITAAKLANAVADQLANIGVTVTDGADGTGAVALQLKDAQGNSLAARAVLQVWFSATAHGAPTDLGDVAATTGQILAEITADALIMVETDATGLAELTYTRSAGDGALHVMAEAQGLVGTGNAAITGN